MQSLSESSTCSWTTQPSGTWIETPSGYSEGRISIVMRSPPSSFATPPTLGLGGRRFPAFSVLEDVQALEGVDKRPWVDGCHGRHRPHVAGAHAQHSPVEVAPPQLDRVDVAADRPELGLWLVLEGAKVDDHLLLRGVGW